MAKIGTETIDYMANQYRALLLEHQTEIDAAYLRLGDEDPLSISLTVKVSPGDNGNNVETNINCVTDRLKDKARGTVDEEQGELFPLFTPPDFWKEDGTQPKIRWPLTIYPMPRVGRPPRFRPLGG